MRRKIPAGWQKMEGASDPQHRFWRESNPQPRYWWLWPTLGAIAFYVVVVGIVVRMVG